MLTMLKSIYRFLSPKIQSVFLEYHVDFKPRKGTGKGGSHGLLYDIVNKNRATYAEHLNEPLNNKEALKAINTSDNEKNENLPAWNNSCLPGLDIVMLYSLVRELKHKKYIEIGSGNSTKVVRKAIEEGQLETKVTSIDPYPRATIDHLADTIVREPIENLKDYSLFESLEAGDVVFIDNSHRCFPNSDVTVCFLEILPILKPGVIVHVHDIYIPYDYPQFMCDRAYSEQYVLAAMVLANPIKYKPLMPNFFVSEDEELSQVISPMWDAKHMQTVEKHGGSFWLEIGA